MADVDEPARPVDVRAGVTERLATPSAGGERPPAPGSGTRPSERREPFAIAVCSAVSRHGERREWGS